MQNLMEFARTETERRMLKKMEERGFPGSVKATVFGTIQKEPEAAAELEELLDKGATTREMVKAVQPIMRRHIR